MIQFLIRSLLTTILLVSFEALGANQDPELVGLLKLYKESKSIEMNVSKTVTYELLGKKTQHQGKIWIAGQKFKWSNETPEKSLLVSDGKSILNIQYPDKDLGGDIQVIKSKVDTKKSPLIALLTNVSEIPKFFEQTKKEEAASNIKFTFKTKSKDIKATDLVIVADFKNKKILNISYKDEVGNKTEFSFTEIQFLKKPLEDKFFKLEIPKNAQVTEL